MTIWSSWMSGDMEQLSVTSIAGAHCFLTWREWVHRFNKSVLHQTRPVQIRMSRSCWNALRLSVITSAVYKLCPHSCRIPEGRCGFCGVRTYRNGRIVSTAYGKISSMAFDPIEKKSLHRFHPGSQTMSTGSMGCNMRCPFCQNYEIPMQGDAAFCVRLQPQKPVDIALQQEQRDNIGIAYTHDEPLVNFEFVLACCKLARQYGLKNVVVANGCIQEQKLLELFPYVDAMSTDVKAFNEEDYRRLQGGFIAVRCSVGLTVQYTHVEITSLMVPGLHDNVDRIEEEAVWLASPHPDIPLHLTRFFPMYHIYGEQLTVKQLILKAVKVVSGRLRCVYVRNM